MKTILYLTMITLLASCAIKMPKRPVVKPNLPMVVKRRLEQIRCVERFVMLEVEAKFAGEICKDIFTKGE